MLKLNLVICEKPSQAASYASVLNANKREDGFFIGNGYIVSWCFGHLLELAPPDAYDERYTKWRYTDLPIIPKAWKHIPAKGKAAQLKTLKTLLNRIDVDCIINGCDAGREGENIFRLVYEYAKCKKPIKRLWISSMEDAAILEGFQSLRPGADYDNLYAAASCRDRADWIVGLNCTRLFTVLYGTTLNTGRVQSPTLAMLVKREADISSFIKEPFFTPVIELGGFTANGEKHKERAAVDAIAAACDGRPAKITDIERVKKAAQPPKLYDLTTLQRDANRLLGYTAHQTLEYAQSLYEKKLLSYPRSDAKHISEDMRGTVLQIIGDIGFMPDLDRLIGAVSDHHAIIPTLASKTADLSTLAIGERAIYELVCKRLTAAVSPKHIYEAVTVTLDCAGEIFTAKGKTIITAGWKTQEVEKEDGDDAATLPELSQGQIFDSVTANIKEGATSPPKHFTEDTILSAMENAGAEDMPDDAERKGLGTPATRAAIIEKLVKSGFVERRKKHLIPTDKGKSLVAVLPDSLTSPMLTAQWEHKLKQIERGQYDSASFITDIVEFTRSIVAENAAANQEYLQLFPQSNRKPAEPLGKCPRCGAPVREGEKGFFCDNKECGFKLWKASKFWTAKKKPLTAAIVKGLLEDGRVAVKGLHSEKAGRKYDAIVSLNDSGSGYVNFKMEFLTGRIKSK